MDKNNLIGFGLMLLLLIGWSYFNKPSAEQMAEQERLRDSIELVNNSKTLNETKKVEIVKSVPVPVPEEMDSTALAAYTSGYGPFAPSAVGEEKFYTLENSELKITLSNKGGRITNVLVKNYNKIATDTSGAETKIPLSLMEDEKNVFEYQLPVANNPAGFIGSQSLTFQAEQNGNEIIFKAPTSSGGYFEQRYELGSEGYNVDYKIGGQGLGQVLDRSQSSLKLNWVNYLDKLEKNTSYERNYTSVYYKKSDDDPTYCTCTGDDEENADGESLKWVSHSNQFFNTTLIPKESFSSGLLETKMLDEENIDLKLLKSKLNIPMDAITGNGFAMNMYLGPNEYKRLKAYNVELEELIPYGRSIFGTVNRWVIRPIFNFLSGFIGNKGIVILLLTLLVKLALYPLMYKMLYSQSKMAALKPQLATLKEKFADDSQKQQMETMKLYSEYGVSPLGGCLPMVLQMPIWFALYRFFPASIEFRQASFLWATDLSSFDVAFWLPFEIPFYGQHVSLFTILWAITTLIYTYYNTKHMDMSGNAMMKNMQYLMPVMFLFFFNNFAAGLTCYLLFSNIFNIAQTVITKNYLIDQDKIKAELSANKKKPKKKSGFRAKIEEAMKAQQAQQASGGGKKKK